MNKRDIVIGLAVIAVVVGFVFWKKSKTPKVADLPQPSVEKNIENAFNIKIPETYEKTQLTDVTGGDFNAIATRNYENGRFTHMILTDLPDPETGTFYEGWIVRGQPGDEDFNVLSTGKLRIAKGGYLLEFSSAIDYTDHNGVVVTLETVADSTPEKHILEGSFE